MRLNHFATTLLLSLVIPAWASNSQAQTTIQLPSFSSFSYSGSVLVPVGGSTSLGGVSRSASSRSTRWGNRALSSGLRPSGASVHVTVIDHDAIDRRLRGLPPKDRQPRPASSGTPAHANVSGSKTGDSKASVARVSDPDWEGKALVRYARRQFLAHKWDSAFNAYELAIQSLSPSLATLAKAERDRVLPNGPSAPPRTASQIVLSQQPQ